MPGRIEKTVFISYRRTNKYIALAIYQDLITHQYKVFIDYESINSGDFEQSISENIKAHAHFIVVLTPSALDRCNEPDDWLRREIETAMEYKRNIVPIMMEGFSFGDLSIDKYLTGKLALLKKYQGLEVPMNLTYFKYAMRDLRERYLAIELDAVIHPSSLTAQKLFNEQQIAANKLILIEQKELSGQEWFERGYVLSQNEDFEEAIKSFSESIQLNPSNPYGFLNRGSSKGNINRQDEAILDINQAIYLKPDFAEAYYCRGLAYSHKSDFNKAIEDFKEAIRLKPDYADAYHSRGLTYGKKDEYGKAISDFNKAILLKPDYADAFYGRGLTLGKMGKHTEAIEDFNNAIRLKLDYANAFYSRGVALAHINKHDKAIADFTEAIRLKSDYIDAYWGRGNTWRIKKEYQSAIDDFERYFDLGGKEEIVHNLLNECKKKLG